LFAANEKKWRYPQETNENDGIHLCMYSTIARLKENKQKRDKNKGEKMLLLKDKIKVENFLCGLNQRSNKGAAAGTYLSHD
jgi:hypothetical protein